MSKDPIEAYRELERKLHDFHELYGDDDEQGEEHILEEMDVAWRRLSLEEIAYINANPLQIDCAVELGESGRTREDYNGLPHVLARRIPRDGMTPEQFCYWLQGFFELSDPTEVYARGLSTQQAGMIKDHLKLVFKNVTGGGSGGGGGLEPPERSIYNEPTGRGAMSCSIDMPEPEPWAEPLPSVFTVTCGMERSVKEIDPKILQFLEMLKAEKDHPFRSHEPMRYC